MGRSLYQLIKSAPSVASITVVKGVETAGAIMLRFRGRF